MIFKTVFSAIVLATTFSATPSVAGPFDGIYRPDYDETAGWSCNEQDIGMDGGAVAIRNERIEGVENSCLMTTARPVAGSDSIAYTLVCSAEGEEYTEEITIGRTASGVAMVRGGTAISWRFCAQANAPVDDGWQYANGVALISSQGKTLALSCSKMPGDPRNYATARLSGFCPECGFGQMAELSFVVDGEISEPFAFEKDSTTSEWESPLYFEPIWDRGIIPALMKGSQLVVRDSYPDDNDIVRVMPFALRGSSNALGQLQARCR